MSDEYEKLFTPDIEAEKRYKAQLNAFLNSSFKGSKSYIIDMGNLPKIYTELGITNNRIKTNGLTILKALGIKIKNHKVPKEVLENIMPLIHNPEAVFKSLSKSGKSKSFISILNANAKNQDQIIAILSPSKNTNGYTFIPSIYEKKNFEKFLEKHHNNEMVIYIKEKGSKLLGRPLWPPLHNSEPYIKSIQTKESIVKQIIARNQENKEQSMSDFSQYDAAKEIQVEAFQQDLKADENVMSPEEAAFRNALHQRQIIMEAVKNGTLACLPGIDGLADTTPAVNLTSGDFYHGKNLLYLKEHQKQHNFPTAEYITPYQLDRAKEANPEISTLDGQKPVTLNFSEKNNETQVWENKIVELYNISQTTSPEKVKDWVANIEQHKEEKMLTQFSESYKPREQKERQPGPEIICKSTEPGAYLAQYLAAVSMGGTFKVNPDQAKEFSEKLNASVYERMENGHTDPFKLSKISNEASKQCKDVMREVSKEIRQNNQEQKLEKQQPELSL